MSSELVQIAVEGLKYYLQNGKYLPQSREIVGEPKGVFVSIKRDGKNRGCMGTLVPVTSSLYEEVLYNTVKAAIHDARFFPVTLAELSQLTITVDVIGDEEEVTDLAQLDPINWGIHVISGKKSGVMLPSISTITTADEQLAKARQKAKIGSNEPITIKRFKTVRHY